MDHLLQNDFTKKCRGNSLEIFTKCCWLRKQLYVDGLWADFPHGNILGLGQTFENLISGLSSSQENKLNAWRLGRQNWVPHLQKMGLPNLESKVYSGMTWTAAGSLIEVKHRNTWPRGISCCETLLCPGTQEEAAHHMALLSISLPQDAVGAQTSRCFQGHPQHLTYTTLLLSDPSSKPRWLTKLSKKTPDL